LIEATARRSADALRLSPADIAKRLMVAGSLEDVFNEVRMFNLTKAGFGLALHVYMPRTGRVNDMESSPRVRRFGDWLDDVERLKRIEVTNSQVQLIMQIKDIICPWSDGGPYTCWGPSPQLAIFQS